VSVFSIGSLPIIAKRNKSGEGKIVTEIRFYQLKKHPLEQALPKLIEKVVSSGAKAVIMVESKERIATLSSMMWTYDPGAFLAHGSAEDGHDSEQPVWLTTSLENPNGASVLVLTDGALHDGMDGFEKCLEIFNGNDEQALTQARERWKIYEKAGYSLTYYEQTDQGGWQTRK
jgi:DNA polymerase-3 subunit chi